MSPSAIATSPATATMRAKGNQNWGAADQAFIRLTEARYGDPDANGNRAINPIFKDLDPRVISNILGDQEAGLPKAGNDANAFFMAFGQYVDHGLDFLPKGGNGTIAIGAPGGGQPGSGNPADLTRGTVIGYDEDGTPLHKNQTSPYVDQNQAYGSHSLIGQFLREGDGEGGLGAHLLAGAPDPSNPDFNLLPTLRELIEHHWENDTVFVHASLPGGEMSFRDYYTDYQVSPGVTGTLFTPGANGQPGAFDPGVLSKFISNFMGSTHPLLLDTNPFISVLDHYVAGDGRANENFALTSIHTIWARNHNHHVEGLEAAGFEGTDEELYQAAKMVNEAEYQRVVFDEYVDVLLGGLRSEGTHGFEEYDPDTNAAISHEFAAAAFRFGHSLVSETLTVLDANGNPVAVPLVDAFLNPSNAQGVFSMPLPPGYTPAPGYAQHGVNAIIGGTISQASEAVDFNIVDAVRDNLTRVSADLFAFNVARGWDVGLGTLNQIRMDLAASNSRYVQEAVGFAGGNLTPIHIVGGLPAAQRPQRRSHCPVQTGLSGSCSDGWRHREVPGDQPGYHPGGRSKRSEDRQGHRPRRFLGRRPCREAHQRRYRRPDLLGRAARAIRAAAGRRPLLLHLAVRQLRLLRELHRRSGVRGHRCPEHRHDRSSGAPLRSQR